MKEYKMRRGEHLDDRIPDLEATVESYFGAISGTEEHNGHELYVVDDPDNAVFNRIVVGAAEYSGKKASSRFTSRNDPPRRSSPTATPTPPRKLSR